MKQTIYSKNLKSLAGNKYWTTRKKFVLEVLDNGKLKVWNKTFDTLNSALNELCDLESRADDSLRARDMINIETGDTLKADIYMAEAINQSENFDNDTLNDLKHEEQACYDECRNKAEKLAANEINFVEMLLDIKVPDAVKTLFTDIATDIIRKKATSFT